MKLAAGHEQANIVNDTELGEEYNTPAVDEPRVVPAVGAGVAEDAGRTGVARRKRG
jgi:malic enzyme